MASEYGWTKDYILDNLYLLEVLNLLDIIQTRRINESLLSLAIVQNPFSENPKALYEELRKGVVGHESDNRLDRAGLERLKQKIKKESKFIKAKDSENRRNNSKNNRRH